MGVHARARHGRRNRRPTLLSRRTLFVAILALALLGGASCAMAWSDGPAAGGKAGYGYGTHDWLLDHAIHVAGKPEWVDVSTALHHTNDPDYFKTNSDWHLFRDTGKSRGGPQAVADYYYAAVQALKKGDTATASEKLGVMSHYYTDMLVPFHTTYDAISHEAEHKSYELAVDHYHRNYQGATNNPEWVVLASSKNVCDVREMAIKAAYFSRSKYATIRDTYRSGNVESNDTVNKITQQLMSRGINDLADIIRSMSNATGESPPPHEVRATITKHYPGRGRKICVYAKCLDTSGHILQGIRVKFSWPDGNGGTTTVTAYSDVHGIAHCWYTVPSDMPLMKKYTVKTTSSSSGTTTVDSTWFMVTAPLAAGSSGIKTALSDHSPYHGDVVRVSTAIRDVRGRPVVGLPCTFTWSFKSGPVSHTVVTGGDGVARMSKDIGQAARGHRVYVRAQVMADSTHRSSTSRLVPR